MQDDQQKFTYIRALNEVEKFQLMIHCCQQGNDIWI
jgi:hypothetical protein